MGDPTSGPGGNDAPDDASPDPPSSPQLVFFDLDETTDLDGNVEHNPARFINHSCSPNCEAQSEEDRIWIVALRDIKAGEELGFNYGYDLEDYLEHPCRCGAKNCVGYIVAEEFCSHFQKNREASVVVPQ